MRVRESEFSFKEEIANSIVHGLGLVLAIVGVVVLLVYASLKGDALHIVSVSIFGASLLLLYGSSTLYHSIPNARVKRVLERCDLIAIYLLIAGSYTPILLVNLRGPWGWSIFGVVWGIAALGIAFQFSLMKGKEAVRVASYVGMGWMMMLMIKPLFEAIEIVGFLLIVAGGLAYTGGIVFYIWNKLPYNHAIWHAFVLAGSAFHYFAILLYLAPPAA
ncbi:MAG: hemolysin III family protein [Planctomycetes bacterium]|nr:hemolysin III family protein [Planctomycetota bacterium]